MITKEIKNRRAVRDYKAEEVSEEHIAEIIKAGQFAPSARDNRTIEFVVAKDQETKNKIFDILGGEQEYVKEAPVLIIPVTDAEKTTCPLQDIAAASENMFLQAASLGLGTVWKNVRTGSEGEEGVKKLLGIPSHLMIANIIPVGYPKETPEPHSDSDFREEKIHREKW